MVEFRGDSSRVASLTIKINTKYYLQVVQVYTPTSTHEDEEVEEFHKEVSKIMGRNKSCYKIVRGDFNAKVGGHQQGNGAVVGQYGYGERNERRTRLVQFATSENLTISNTCFKKRKSRKSTWRSPNGLVKIRLTTSGVANQSEPKSHIFYCVTAKSHGGGGGVITTTWLVEKLLASRKSVSTPDLKDLVPTGKLCGISSNAYARLAKVLY